MNEKIEVGDLVMVVKPKPCGCTDTIGIVFTVSNLNYRRGFWCSLCNGMNLYSGLGAFGYKNYSFPLYRLKRIDPPALTDDLETVKELETRRELETQ